MVYRGKPAKGCQRCRERKLRCNLLVPSCSSCFRAGVPCSGYRDTSTLRIDDQTEEVRLKVLRKQAKEFNADGLIAPRPKSLSLDLLVQARQLFYSYYVTDFSRTWDFLCPFMDRNSAPQHLTLSIDAASLAFLYHQTYSQAAKALSLQKYVAALRNMNLALQDARTARVAATLDSTLLLDFFERITHADSHMIDSTTYAHVEGSLALVRLRGLSEFRDQGSLQALSRIVLNSIITAMRSGSPIPHDVVNVRKHAAAFVDTANPKWRLSGLMIDCTDLASVIRRDRWDDDKCLARCRQLDQKFEELYRDLVDQWRPRRIVPAQQSKRMLEEYFYLYPDRTLTQATNVMRVTRILLCEEILRRNPTEHTQTRVTVEAMIRAICASTPQMTDTELLNDIDIHYNKGDRTYTLSNYLDIYVLIFPLYVAAWSSCCPPLTQEWITNELGYIAENYGIKQAAVVKDLLKDGARAGPWEVYRILGSSAFAA